MNSGVADAGNKREAYFRPTPVERISGVSQREFVRSFRDRLKPVVITDATSHWPALKKWTPEYFANEFGHKTVKIDRTQIRLTIGELIDSVRASTVDDPAPYLASFSIVKDFPEIRQDVLPRIAEALPDRLDSRFLPRGGYGVGRKWHCEGDLYIGGSGAAFRLHYDVGYGHAFSSQVYGTKEFRLFPHDQAELLYVEEKVKPDVFRPDFERYPRLRYATPYSTTLQPGDTLFIPGGWWHTTRLEEPSISLSITTISASNWSAYRRSILEDSLSLPNRNLAKVIAKDLYLRAVGGVLSLTERFQLRG